MAIVQVIRKERAVGIIPTNSTLYEVLEDLAITVDMQLLDEPVPFCAFNGGGDVFVDIGNKSLGLHALKKYLGARAHQVCCLFAYHLPTEHLEQRDVKQRAGQ
jgi:IMP and pyridine-specific 5'-nucleotidase